jgi:hypothetical protein
MRNVLTKAVDKIKTHILFMFSNFFPKIIPFEIMWKNVVELNRPQMMIQRLFFARWMTKASDTRLILIAFLCQDSLVCIAACYRLDSPEIQSLWG